MTSGVPHLIHAVAVGRVSPRGVRLWMRSPGGGPHRLALWPEAAPQARREFGFDAGDRRKADDTYAFAYPDHFEGAPRLDPVTRYGFEILRGDGTPVGRGRFETLPAERSQMPKEFSFGVASCHQPFDKKANLGERGLRMLRVAHKAWTQNDVKLVMWVGDQLYADFPENQSLFDPDYFRTVGPPGKRDIKECSEDEVRDVYFARYRRNWGHPFWLRLQSDFPGYPILDDHEVVDNFGSKPEHHSERWRHIRRAAETAYRHYQHERVDSAPPKEGPYDYSFEYGSAVAYVLDTRSQRKSTDGDHARVFAPHQLEGFSAWLNANAAAPVAFVVLAVPPFFMPGWASRIAAALPGNFREDAHDRWMHPQYRKDRERMLRLIREHQTRHPRQKVVLVAGDVHVGFVSCCDWRSDPPTHLYQFVSSSISHVMSPLNWQLARHVPRTHFLMTDVGPHWARIHMVGRKLTKRIEQPVGGLNVGVIQVRCGDEKAELNFKLYGEDEKTPDEPKLLYESDWV